MKTVPALISAIFLSFNLSAQSVSSKDVITLSSKYLGAKYSYGKASPKAGFDCSGFIFYIFSYFHIAVPRTSLGFAGCKTVHPDSCRPGDVIVFTGTNPKRKTPEHVGIVLSKSGNNIRFIHSSSSKKKPGVKISTFSESPSYKKRFIKIVRVANLS